MTWIKVIDVPQAEGALRKAYDKVASARGEVGNSLKAHSLHPNVLSAHLHLYRELMFGRFELSRAERERIQYQGLLPPYLKRFSESSGLTSSITACTCDRQHN